MKKILEINGIFRKLIMGICFFTPPLLGWSQIQGKISDESLLINPYDVRLEARGENERKHSGNGKVFLFEDNNIIGRAKLRTTLSFKKGQEGKWNPKDLPLIKISNPDENISLKIMETFGHLVSRAKLENKYLRILNTSPFIRIFYEVKQTKDFSESEFDSDDYEEGNPMENDDLIINPKLLKKYMRSHLRKKKEKEGHLSNVEISEVELPKVKSFSSKTGMREIENLKEEVKALRLVLAEFSQVLVPAMGQMVSIKAAPALKMINESSRGQEVSSEDESSDGDSQEILSSSSSRI